MIQFFQQLLSRLGVTQSKRKPKPQSRRVNSIPDEMAEAMASRMKLDAERHRNRNNSE